MWYVVPHGAAISIDTKERFDSPNDAAEHAHALHQLHGDHYHVVKVQVVWTTQTLAEAMEG